ncbi:MAG: Ig-like domain-containing protein [Bacillota bacterium]|nr:Ig-like domain-containing protein [Bacillota bacterium]
MERITKNIFTVVLATAVLLIMILAFDSTEASAAHKPFEKGQYFKVGTCIIPGEGYGQNGGHERLDRGDTFTYNGEHFIGTTIFDDDEEMFESSITIAYAVREKRYIGYPNGKRAEYNLPHAYYDGDRYRFYMIAGASVPWPVTFSCISEDKGIPWGVQILDGDGTRAHPFKFGVLFSEPYGIQVYTPEHGKISFIPPNAEAGDEVKFKVRADSGYKIKSIGMWYFNEDGASEVYSLDFDEEGNSSFIMPDKDVKLDVTFEPKEGLAGITKKDGSMTMYQTLDEAVSNWENNSTLTLYEGAKIDEPMEITGNKTLDLNGYVLKSDSSLFSVKGGGSLTVNDSDPGHKSYFEEKEYTGGYLLGSVDGSGDGEHYAIKGLIDVAKGKCIINGGSLINESDKELKWILSGTEGAKITINGGYMKANRAVIMDSDKDVFVQISGGRFDLERTYPILQEGIDNNYSVINITGGYYKKDPGAVAFSDLVIGAGYKAENKADQTDWIDWEYDDYAYRVEDERTPYVIAAAEDVENGTIGELLSYARPGDSVALTAKPAAHYKLNDFIVTDADGNNVPVIDEDGNYSFTMPEAAVTVNAEFVPILVSDIRINKTRLNLTQDGSEKLKAEVVPIDAMDREITWESDDEDVATVDSEGNVEATGLGETRITATAAGGGISVSCHVLVYHEHRMTKVDSTDATCSKEGNTEYWKCDRGGYACGKLFSDENGDVEITEDDTVIPINADRHGEPYTDMHTISERSCTSPLRQIIVTRCLDCGAQINVFTRGLAALGHKWGQWEVTKEATDTEDGEMRRVCENDEDHVQTRIIPAGNHQHDIEKVEAKEPTCTEPGNIEYWKCTECEHCFADAEGNEELYPDDVVIIQLGHHLGKEVKENVVEATCFKPKQYESVIRCDREGCGKVLSRETVIEGSALGHDWSDWEAVDELSHKRVCANGGHTDEMGSHNWDDGQFIRPTCKDEGKTIYTCRDCGATKEKHKLVPDPNAHVYGDATYTWSQDNSKVTATHSCVHDGTVETEEADVRISEIAPTCTEAGKTVYKAGFDKDGFAVQKKEFPGEKAKGHVWNKGKVTKKATVKKNGVKTYTCTVCGEKKTKAIAKAGTVIKGKTVKVSAKKLKKKAQKIKRTKAISLSKGKGTVTYVKGAVTYKKAKSVRMTKKQLKKYRKNLKGKFVIAKKTGKITVKKGLKKGTYKLKVTVKCSGNASYARYTKKVTVTIKI